jgi:hypothetical protein
MSIHFISDPSLQREEYVYENGVGYPKGIEPKVNWKHIDGPLLYTSDAGLHWLTYRERVKLWLGWTTIREIDRRRRRDYVSQ